MTKKLIKIGFISKPHRFNGELKYALDFLSISNDFPEFIWIYLEGKPVPFLVLENSKQKNNFILKIEDIDNEESALKFRNTSIYCEANIFDQYFEKEESLDDLIGFEVEDKKYGKIGKVKYIIDNAIQPTLVLAFKEKEILIPYNEDIIRIINFDDSLIEIETPEGLIDLYLE